MDLILIKVEFTLVEEGIMAMVGLMVAVFVVVDHLLLVEAGEVDEVDEGLAIYLALSSLLMLLGRLLLLLQELLSLLELLSTPTSVLRRTARQTKSKK